MFVCFLPGCEKAGKGFSGSAGKFPQSCQEASAKGGRIIHDFHRIFESSALKKSGISHQESDSTRGWCGRADPTFWDLSFPNPCCSWRIPAHPIAADSPRGQTISWLSRNKTLFQWKFPAGRRNLGRVRRVGGGINSRALPEAWKREPC